MKRHSSRFCAAFLLASGLGWGTQLMASSGPVVGEITTVIGRATVSSLEGEARKVQRGLPVHAGDRLETEAGGHVHVRFIDGGLVSVRPLSRLRIEDYYRGEGTTQGAIRFNLEQGVMRSVTGAWGEENRDRFRLNTPVVAIGIKGTDFVVSTEAAKTLAHVVTGAIFMAPLSSCPNGGSHCATQDSVLLSAEMRDKLLEFNPDHGVATPKLIAATLPGVALENKPELLALRELRPEEKSPLAPSVEGRLGDVVVAANAPTTPRQEAGNVPIPLKETPVDRPMVWGNSPLGWNIAANSIARTMTASTAEEGMKAAVTDFTLSLYRDQSVNPDYLGGKGAVSFNLTAASASFSRPGLFNQAVAINNPRLEIDFQAKSFATRLDLAGSFGNTQFQSSGNISATGLIQQQDSTQKLLGALSNDARQAGYLFEKKVGAGQVSGLTLWGR